MSEKYPVAQAQIVDAWEALCARGDNRCVSVNTNTLDEIASQNPELIVPDWRIPGLHPENDWAFATQAVASSVINFMFLNRNRERDGEGWNMTDPTTGKTLSGSSALHPRLHAFIGESEDVRASQLIQLAKKDAFDNFLPGVPMAEERRELLEDFAYGLHESYSGSVRNLLEASCDNNGDLRLRNNGEGLAERLTDTQKFGAAFLDISYLDNGHALPFNKRANLAPLLIYGRSTTSSTLPRVADIHESGAVPDYRLPQAFRAMGAIAYSDALAHTVDTWQPIPCDSQAEVEIRAATSYSTVYLLRQVNELREQQGQAPYNMAHIDYWLWKMGRELKNDPNTKPPHYTETTAY